MLQQARLELLDLSNRNRLLNTPRRRRYTTNIEIVDELSSEVYRVLVQENKPMSFKPGNERSTATSESDVDLLDDPDWAPLPQPDDDDVNTTGIAARHTDAMLQTQFTSEGLQRRLLSLFYDAKTYIEEQGVNILYLALGMVKWYEAENSDLERLAPLILVPVGLERRSARERFYLRWLGEEAPPNLTLMAKLKSDFGLVIPELGDAEDVRLDSYLEAVSRTIGGQPRWQVETNHIVLGFFSFAKFLMYRDLDAAAWPKDKPIDTNPMLCALLRDGFSATSSPLEGSEEEKAVRRLATEFFVLDSDSSQSLAIEEVRRGHHLVIQGPPGTGKSQTIANIIADAVRRGQTVLFVAEKMAALEVVKRRMDVLQLDGLTLELHSNKANKRAVLEELKRTLQLGQPVAPPDAAAVNRIGNVRSELDGHCERIGRPCSSAAATVYDTLGHLIAVSSQIRSFPELVFEEAFDWDRTGVVDREALVRDMADRIRRDGLPVENPWCGTAPKVLLTPDIQRLTSRSGLLAEALGALWAKLRKLSGHLKEDIPATLLEATQCVARGIAVALAPPMDKSCLDSPAWQKRRQLESLLQAGKKYANEFPTLQMLIRDEAWEENLKPMRIALERRRTSWFAFLSSDYRAAKKHLNSLCRQEVPADPFSFLDRVIDVQTALSEVRVADVLGREAFGQLWKGEVSDWALLQRVADWLFQHEDLLTRKALQRMDDLAKDGHDAIELQKALGDAQEQLGQFFRDLRADCNAIFGVSDLGRVSASTLEERLYLWQRSPEPLSRWTYLQAARTRAEQYSLSPLTTSLWNGQITPDEALGAFRSAYHMSLLRHAVEQEPSLGLFEGTRHCQNVSAYQVLDAATQVVARFETALTHWKGLPRGAGAIGPMGVLKTEIEKRRRHLPLRQLIKHAGPAIQRIKPVFMMSPLSVAQFLEPGAVEFDLLVFDEASQVQPVDAFGAILRARQLIVVGDDRQLPPTRFFSRLGSNQDDNEESEVGEGARDIESILGLCRARGLSERMLRWHYRSRHHSLIAVSNREFYDNSLYIVPSPWTEAASMGLRFRFVRGGIFDTGGSGTNRVEARAVAEAITNHAVTSPGLSLGVGTFSIKQKQAILDELEVLRRRNPSGEAFFNSHPEEPFFVKNLENIQGDERDVIFISVGYAKNSSGYMAMRFGPLSAEGGERRLNVLISRAKRRCEVFTSVTAEDIDLERGRGRGVAGLKAFLNFAEKGILDVGQSTGRDHDSPFEEEVARVLRSHGYEVRRQIGIAGFFIDLAVVHPRRTGRYAVGIECDGATYHSMRSVRDRDRLRQAVLEDHGWHIHRIWSWDWFQRPQEQLQRTIEAIEAAIAETEQEDPADQAAESMDWQTFSRDDETVAPPPPSISAPYTEAAFTIPGNAPHELELAALSDIVRRIVEAEAPIHEEEIVARVRQLWGLSRAGSRIQAAVDSAIKYAAKTGAVIREGAFCSLTESKVVVRDRSQASSSGLRKPAMLPPTEIRCAILAIIDQNDGAGTHELCTTTARLLGFAATSSVLRSVIENEIEALERTGVLRSQHEIWLRT